MIAKIFYTMLVIVIVGMIFRSQNQAKVDKQRSKQNESEASEQNSMAPKSVAYLLIALLILVSGVVYYFSWSDANQLITLRVINSSGTLTEYQAYRKDIRGREFSSIDGVTIQLADSDRLEMIER